MFNFIGEKNMNKEQEYMAIKIQLIGGSEYVQTIELTDIEARLFLQHSENGWNLMCENIKARLGVDIIGNFNLISYSRDGQIFKPLH